MVDNLRELENDKLFDHVQIYQRDRSCVYDSATDEGVAADVLQEYLFGKWSKTEEEMLQMEKNSLKRLYKVKENGNSL